MIKCPKCQRYAPDLIIHRCLADSESEREREALGPLDAVACSAFFIRRATPPTYTRWTSGRHGSGVRENAGTAATIMVCGIEWTSRVPRTETECDKTNAWAEKIISQNADVDAPAHE